MEIPFRLNEYERGVIFRLGRVIGAKGPGLILLIPVIDKMVRVGLRVVAMEVPAQDVITRDNVTINWRSSGCTRTMIFSPTSIRKPNAK
jgi:regulator of protease activity HflC (stomatin/prohibitin superfamily)